MQNAPKLTIDKIDKIKGGYASRTAPASPLTTIKNY